MSQHQPTVIYRIVDRSSTSPQPARYAETLEQAKQIRIEMDQVPKSGQIRILRYELTGAVVG